MPSIFDPGPSTRQSQDEQKQLGFLDAVRAKAAAEARTRDAKNAAAIIRQEEEIRRQRTALTDFVAAMNELTVAPSVHSLCYRRHEKYSVAFEYATRRGMQISGWAISYGAYRGEFALVVGTDGRLYGVQEEKKKRFAEFVPEPIELPYSLISRYNDVLATLEVLLEREVQRTLRDRSPLQP